MNEKELQESLEQSIKSWYQPTCPMCRAGNLVKMDAGDRGKSFAEGNFLGAFVKSHVCSSCGYSC
jgi:hypothetical protein